jgi:membrane protease YdiL (CAAX protease family)
VGAAFGAALGFHFWIAARALGGIPGAMPAGTALWLLAVATGYRSLGEEVALRGLVYPGLLQAGHPRVPAAIRTVILGSALYLPLAAAAAAPVSLLVVLYGVLFGATATVLRHATGNTVVTLAASVVFQMFLGGALLG